MESDDQQAFSLSTTKPLFTARDAGRLSFSGRRDIPAVIQKIAQACQPERIVLFGSYAYGEPTTDSDVDLLVVLEDETSPLEAYLKVARLLRPRPFPIDLLIKTPDELRQALNANDSFIREILSRGKAVYERDF